MKISDVLDALRLGKIGPTDARGQVVELMMGSLAEDAAARDRAPAELRQLAETMADAVLSGTQTPAIRASRPVATPPCDPSTLIEQTYRRECRGGQWFHVVDETFECPDGTRTTTHTRTATGITCTDETSVTAGPLSEPASPPAVPVDHPATYSPPDDRPIPMRPDDPPLVHRDDGPPLHTVSTPVTMANRKWVMVNLKVVNWIPFRPENQILRTPSGAMHPWYGGMDSWSEPLVKTMLSTGNPDPPTSFPTRASYDAFVETKEFRAIMDRDLLICCDEQGHVVQVIDVRRDRTGFTPAGAGEPPGDGSADSLHKYHLDHESVGSKLNRAKNRPPLNPNAPQPYPNPDPFTQGNAKDESRGPQAVGDCGLYWPKTAFQVNDDENLGFGIVSGGYILPYMWIDLSPTKLCCPGTLSVSGVGSAIPSKALYVNNVQVSTYDMMSAPWAEIYKAMFAAPISGQKELAVSPNLAPDAPQMPGVQLSAQKTYPLKDGCPDKMPIVWLYDKKWY